MPWCRGAAATGLLLGSVVVCCGQQSLNAQQAAEDYRQGVAAFSRNDLQNALQHFQNVVRLNPEAEPGHLMLGFVLARLGKAKEAIPELEKAVSLNPNDGDARTNLALAYEQSGALAKAISHFAKLDAAAQAQGKKLAPDVQAAYVRSMYGVALADQDSGKAGEAIPLFRKVVAADPSNAAALTNLGVALCQVQRAKEGVPYLQRAVALSAKSVTARQDLAAAYVNLGQYDDAIAALRAALKLAPNDARLHYNLGVAFKMKDEAASAIPELKEAERLDPAQPEAPYVLGMVYSQTGQMESAAQELSASLKLRGENGEGWSTLGTVYNSLGKYPEAETALREAIRQLPDQADPHLTLATVFASEDKPTEAAAERRLAADLMRAHMNLQRAEVATGAGQSLLKGGNIAEAIVQFRDALSYDPKYVEAHLGLAAALERQGNVIDAAAERQRANALKKATGTN